MSDYPGKRLLDVVGASAGAALFAPVMAAIATATWLEDGPPLLFLQRRVGRDRAPFTTFKLRTMRAQRVTQVGQWLRRTGLDEVPQFLNVCRGEMSLVGPRPLTANDIERLGWHSSTLDWRFAAKPGITGLSQLLAGRGAKASRRLDRLYLERQSLRLDVQLLALSFAANIVGKTAVREWIRQARPRVAPSRAAGSPPLKA